MHSQRGRSSNRGHHCKAVNYREAYGIYVQEMVASDLADAKKYALLKHHGYNVNVSVE